MPRLSPRPSGLGPVSGQNGGHFTEAEAAVGVAVASGSIAGAIVGHALGCDGEACVVVVDGGLEEGEDTSFLCARSS
jgi:hypothetical protein